MVKDTAREYDASLLNPVRTKHAMDPHRLVKFIDCPQSKNPTQRIAPAVTKQKTKLPSWNGEKCDVRPFEKFAPPENVVLTKEGRHETVDHRTASDHFRQHQPIVLVDQTKHELYTNQQQLHAPLQTRLESYAEPAQIENLPVPESVFLSEGLMHPKQRRERLQFETKYQLARQELKKMELQERRMHQLIRTQHWTNDVFAPTSPTQHRAWTSPYVSVKAYKPDLLSHQEFDGAAHPSTALKVVQTKKRVVVTSDQPPGQQISTHDRLFGPKACFVWNAERAQNLRNQHEAGRSFNIINGGDIGFLPPTIQEKQHARQAHPSIIVHPYTR